MKNAITRVILDISNSPDRTSTYQKAILDNPTDFAGKVIKNTLMPKNMEDSNAASGRDGRRSWFWNPFLLRPAGWR